MVVVKVTSVPSWTGVPPPSMTVAVTWADPPRLTVVRLLKRVMDEFDGATRAILSQAAAPNATSRQAMAHSTDGKRFVRRTGLAKGAIIGPKQLKSITTCT
jgi:hypothetical protein